MRRTETVLILVVLASASATLAQPIPVPNFSFESPPVVRDEKNPFGALPFLDDWDETAVGLDDEFDQNTGVFINTNMGDPDFITNAHLSRMGFLSSLIGNAVRQELPEVFETNRSYTVTVALGKSFTFPVGSTEEIEIALFYFSGGVEQIIESTLISGAEVGTTTLTDFSVTIPLVSADDPWAKKQIGVLIRPSTADPNDGDGEGFWNLDHVRLDATESAPAVSTLGVITLASLIGAAGASILRRRNPRCIQSAN